MLANETMSCLTQRKILSPFEQRSNLYGFENPCNKNWTVGKESSSSVSDTSKTSTLLMICDARNWILFFTEFMLICKKTRRLGFSSLNDFRMIFWRLSFSLSLLIWLLDRLDFLRQIASSSSSAILAYLSFFDYIHTYFCFVMAFPHSLRNILELIAHMWSKRTSYSPETSNMMPTAEETNNNNVKDNQNERKKQHGFQWAEKEIELSLENFYFYHFLVAFHVVHTLRKVFQNDFALLFLEEGECSDLWSGYHHSSMEIKLIRDKNRFGMACIRKVWTWS